MGKLCLAEKYVEDSLTELSAAPGWYIGLLIGASSETKEFIVHFAKTPLEEDVASGVMNLDELLLTSHAEELLRMVPGGLCVCGLALVGGPDVLQATPTKLQQLMMAVYRKLNKSGPTDRGTDQWQLITLENVTKKFTCRSLLVSDYKSAFKPMELRFQSLNSGWLVAKTSLVLNRHFYLLRQQQDLHFEQQIRSGLSPYFTMIDTSLCSFNGVLQDKDALLGVSSYGAKGKKGSQESLEPEHINVQLFGKPQEQTGSSCEEAVSSISIRGTVSAVAFLRAPATASQIERALKADLKKSVTARCQLLCDDILQVGSEKHSTEAQLIYETPPRVYLPLPTLPILFNDYMFKDEKSEDCVERAQQLLGIRIESDAIDTSVERSANGQDVKDFDDSAKLEPESELLRVSSKPSSPFISIGKLASIASGAAIVLAVSLSYLKMDNWF